MERRNAAAGGADHLVVAEHVRKVLGIKPPQPPPPSPLDDLPLDPIANIDATRAVLKRLGL